MPNNVDSVITNEALQQTTAPPCSPGLFTYFSAPLQLAAKRLVINILCNAFLFIQFNNMCTSLFFMLAVEVFVAVTSL